MLIRNRSIRIFKFLGKTLLVLLLILFALILLVHVSTVQQRINRKLTTYLCAKTKGRVEIQRLEFSLLGDLKIEGLEVWDPDSNKILSAGTIVFNTSIYDLISGKYLFDEIRLENVHSQFIQEKDRSNIQYLFDAFISQEVQVPPPDTLQSDFTIQCKKVILNNIDFQFLSVESGTEFKTRLRNFTMNDFSYSTLNHKIKADQVCFVEPAIHIISTTQQQLSTTQQEGVNNVTTTENTYYFSPDFDTGLGLDIHDFEIQGGEFSFHTDDVKNTIKFDPSHIELSDLQVNLSDILVNTDTLSTVLQSFSVQMPDFTVTNAGADIKMNRNRLVLSTFHLASNTNEINLDLTASYDRGLTHHNVLPNLTITAQGLINPNDLSYFLNDTMMNYFKGWQTTELALEGNYVDGKGDLKTIKVKTANSHLIATGTLEEIMDTENLKWENLEIDGNVGSDFRNAMTPFLGGTKIPPSMQLHMITTGNPKSIYVDGNVLTTWGNVLAKGRVILLPDDIDLDMKMTGKQVRPGEWTGLPWLGPMDLSIYAKGKIGSHQDAQINGWITSITLMDQPVHQITFQSKLGIDKVNAVITIEDPNYRSKFQSDISYAGPTLITNEFQFNGFELGRLLKMDSTLILSGDLLSNITIDQSSIAGIVNGKQFMIKNQNSELLEDTFYLAALLSPTESNVEYFTPDGKGSVSANFDLRELPGIIQPWVKNIMKSTVGIPPPTGNRNLQFVFQMDKPGLLQLSGITVDEFSPVNASGEFDEQKQSASLKITTGKFKGYGVSLDTLFADVSILRDSINAVMNANNLFYNTINLGNMEFDLVDEGDTAISNLILFHDSISTLHLGIRILPADTGIYIYPDKLLAFRNEYSFDRNNPIFIHEGNLVMNNFVISHEDMQMNINGDLKAFDVNFTNIDLTTLNPFLSTDSVIINHGYLNGTISYAPDQVLDLKANVDSLILYQSVPLTITLSAVRNENQVPFEFLLSSKSNNMDVHGQYFLDNEVIDASLVLNINDPETFAFLYSDYLEELKGKISAKTTIYGPIKKPDLNGYLRFQDLNLTSTAPRLSFSIKDDSIKLDNSGLAFNEFKIYDKEQNPLTISGTLVIKDYPSFAYDLNINANNYALINNPEDAKDRLKGLLVIDTDIDLAGNEKDTHVKADIAVKDNTNLTLILASDEDALLNTVGIVEFIDPNQLIDSTQLESENMYDSIVASLPDFNLNSKIKVEDNATIRIITDAQSGDYFEASGGANLELGMDRTGNPRLSGNYTIKKGLYRLSFYDLVKKTFTLVPGSSITWSGSPESGEIDIKAIHTVTSNSIGLIGHEIGESEKSAYKRSLDYEVGINIQGTVEVPIITFSLDLPEADKANYPVLANKLDRLKLPEFQSELNKQVFGLLVLGGFMPESTGIDVDQSQVAQTALYNSVNSILASQLNRFAGQHFKGVNIDVGIQSYADYSTPGGKTQTAMDVRVSKSVFNDRLSFEVGGEYDINSDQSGSNTGDHYRGDVAIIYDLTGNGDKQLKLFNNESYDIIYQEIRNTGISLIFIREFNKGEKNKKKDK